MEKNVWIVFVAYFALIGFAVYYTHNQWCLLALLISPTFSSNNEENKKDNNEVQK